MLSKLLKYEFKSTARILLPMYIAVIIYSALCRGLYMLSEKLRVLEYFIVFMYFLYFVLVVAVVVVTFVLVIQRFYKNLMGDEGYLMFTLPVEPRNHIITKSLTAFIWTIVSVIVAFISIVVLFFSPEVIDGIKEILAQIPAEFVPTVIYTIVLLIFNLLSGIFMIYTAMSIGQLVSGHKLLGSAVAYFGLYVVNQIVMASILGVFGYANRTSLFVESITITSSMLLPLIILITVVYAVFICAYFFVTNYIFKNKLNLE